MPGPSQPHAVLRGPAVTLAEALGDAVRFWEPRRLIYNAVLAAIVGAWLLLTWPHFRPALEPGSLVPLAVLALLANACYCAAYLPDLGLQRTALAGRWRQHRWLLWLAGTLLAALLANYWIADEIYPAVGVS